MKPLTLALVLALGGCSTEASLSGQLGGEEIAPPQDAAYDTVVAEFPLVGRVQAFTLVISDIPDACDTLDDFESNIEIGCDEQCEDWSRLANERLEADAYYTLQMLAVVDPDRVEGSLRLGGGLLPAENEFKGELTTFDVSHLYDEAGCVTWCEGRNPVIPTTVSRLSAGELTLSAFATDEALEGELDISLGADELKGAFKADRCVGLPGLP